MPIPVQRAIAAVSFLPRHSAVIIDSVVGYNMPPDTPTAICAPIRKTAVGDQADMSENGTQRNAPSSSIRLRPYRSPTAPRYRTVAAIPSWYASVIPVS